jgi:hypothetical protein
VTNQVTTVPGNGDGARLTQTHVHLWPAVIDQMRSHQTKPACMVRRRSTVRFRNGALQVKGNIRKKIEWPVEAWVGSNGLRAGHRQARQSRCGKAADRVSGG